MYYYLYQITNKVNNKIYVGVHRTEDVEDGYFGSGDLLKLAIKKYGRDNFEKTILGFFENEDDMYKAELEVVDEKFLQREDVYNITTGGNGFTSFSSKKANEKRQELLKNDIEFRHRFSKRCREQGRKTFEDNLGWFSNEGKSKQLEYALSDKNISLLRENSKNLINNEEARKKRKETFKKIGFQKGSNNSNYGNCWIYNETLKENKLIKKDILDECLSNGWIKGRKFFK